MQKDLSVHSGSTFTRSQITAGLLSATLLVATLLAACSAATPQPAPVQPSATTAPPTAAPATAAVLPPTYTPTTPPATPTASPAAQTPAPSPTQPLALAVAENGLSAWCLPEGDSLSPVSDPLNPPADAHLGALVNSALEIHNLPVIACVVAYTFNQAPPAGLKLEIFDQLNKTPWLTVDLTPVKDKPNSVAAVLRHSYIIAPPLWNVSYFFAVVDANGKELQRVAANLHRWTPWLCWNGRPPNPLTLRCPLAQDLHPWDPSYGTPVPTAPSP